MSSGFPMVALGEVLVQYQEYIENPELKEYAKLSVKLYGKGVVLDAPADGAALKMKRHQIARSGQVILSEIWGKKGAIGFVPPEGDGALCTNHFFLFDVLHNKLEPKYLQAIFTANYLQSQLDSDAKGTTGYAAVRPKNLLSACIPLPPLEEQRRIVARIEELAAKTEEARGLRRNAMEEVEVLYNGTLATIFNTLVEKNSSCQLNDLIIEAGYGTSAKCLSDRPKDAIPVLRIPNVISEQINFHNMKYGNLESAELARVLVAEGDILVVRTNGSVDLVGRCAVVPPLIGAMAFASYLIRLRCNKAIITPAYFQCMLRHLRTNGNLIDFARTTAGQYNVSLGRLRSARIPVPPLSEQRRIVAYLDDLQARVDAVKQLQAETQAELDALLPSILDKAFRGELV